MIDCDIESLRQLIALAKSEDFGSGDVTTSLLPDSDVRTAFRLIAKRPCTVAGCEIANTVLAAYDTTIELAWEQGVADGIRIETAPATLAHLSGPLGSLLAAERVLLNFLQRLCGIATLTSVFADAVAGTTTRILDTRKTTPGWRSLEKYAVRCGGGHNHRRGLFDGVLIKDNHLAGVAPDRLAASVFELLNRLPSGSAPSLIEVEADTLAQVEELLKVVGITAILLDNFDVDDLRRAVALRDRLGLADKVEFEASGGVTLDTVRAIAETGVDRISVGALTHSAAAIDLSLERV